MDARHAIALLLASGALALAVVNCSSPESVPLGAPNALQGQQPPPAIGLNPNTGDGGSTGTGPGNVCNGGPAIDGGPCAVSFQTKILGYMGAGGTWKCADAQCHGGASPLNQPGIDPGDAQGTWNHMRQITITVNGTATPYINPCSTDPTKASILCNIDPASTAPCGPSMPQVGGAVQSVKPTSAEIQDLKTWITCGSPFN